MHRDFGWERLGEIMEGGIPYADPDSDIFEPMKPQIDVGDPEEDACPLKTADVAEATDDEVYPR